jgi:hypothetical protein
MSIETSLFYINNTSKQLKSQAQSHKNQSSTIPENFNNQLENNLKTTTPIKIQPVDYEKIYKNMKELENIKQVIDSSDKFYNDIKIGLTIPFENYHNLNEEEQNKIKKTTVDIFGAEKGTIQLITCASVRQFYPPRIKIALGEVMSYMTKEESIAFGNNLQKNINNAMKNENLLTTNEKGVVVLNFDEKGFLNFIYSIMKDNETNEEDKPLNNLYEKLLKETDRRYHPFETMEREEALRKKQFQQEKEEKLKSNKDESLELTGDSSITELLSKNELNQNPLNEFKRFSNFLYLENYNSYDYLEVLNNLNKNTTKE